MAKDAAGLKRWQARRPSSLRSRQAKQRREPSVIILPQARSADDGRYVGDGIEFRIKGKNATLKRGGTSKTCASD
jgi:hypothetical protein